MYMCAPTQIALVRREWLPVHLSCHYSFRSRGDRPHILTWLRGFLDKHLYLVLFSLYLSLS